ncbi:CACTA en-spm transposon protein [Cucumis melo var. makuwa]|uniref:CACTA en-spm transposon protein n=1 Tax=Cucumis melo var. makuwa TaxID=1194695 RepID=A0A5D3E4Y6_CUCMM|nr:CACTA en-spm transposon protein [Cucumis melo var. makuwa]TYK30650.1 CACTA en-spm transposon protein [Cucumis melo var. makuwa]
MELERYIHKNGKIPISIVPRAEKSISPHVVRFSNTIGVLTLETFPVCYLKWADVPPKYIEVVKCDLLGNQELNRFIEYQMFMTFKEFKGDCHRHFKKYSDPEEAGANISNRLVNRSKD